MDEVKREEDRLREEFSYVELDGENIPKYKKELNKWIYSNKNKRKKIEDLKEDYNRLRRRLNKKAVSSSNVDASLVESIHKVHYEEELAKQLRSLKYSLVNKIDFRLKKLNLTKEMIEEVNKKSEKADLLKKENFFALNNSNIQVELTKRKQLRLKSCRKNRLVQLNNFSRKLSQDVNESWKNLAVDNVNRRNSEKDHKIKEKIVSHLAQECDKNKNIKEHIVKDLEIYRDTYFKVISLVNESEFVQAKTENLDGVFKYLRHMKNIEDNLKQQHSHLMNQLTSMRAQISPLVKELVNIKASIDSLDSLKSFKAKVHDYFGTEFTVNDMHSSFFEDKLTTKSFRNNYEETLLLLMNKFAEISLMFSKSMGLVFEISFDKLEKVSYFARRIKNIIFPVNDCMKSINREKITRSQSVSIKHHVESPDENYNNTKMLSVFQYNSLDNKHTQADIRLLLANNVIKHFLEEHELLKYLNNAKKHEWYVHRNYKYILEESYSNYSKKFLNLMQIFQMFLIYVMSSCKHSYPLQLLTAIGVPSDPKDVKGQNRYYHSKSINNSRKYHQKDSWKSNSNKIKKMPDKISLPVINSKNELIKELKVMDRSMAVLKKCSPGASSRH